MATLAFPASDGLIIVQARHIARLQSDGGYTHVHRVDGKRNIVCRGIGDLYRMLPKEQFFRCHHSHVINIDLVERVIYRAGHRVLLTTGDYVAVARRRWHDLLDALRKRS